MSQVKAFRGVLYNPAKIDDIARVVAPPYDMIDPAEQRLLHEQDPRNVVRLILGYQRPEDGEGDSRYTRAAATLGEWLEGGVLERDAEPAVYLYEQRYRLARGPALVRRGFIALARLEELEGGRIHPHEKTLSAPKEDRLRLMMACRANFSQIFSFYDDPSGRIAAALEAARPAAPRFELTDGAGVRHTLWGVTDGAAIEETARLMETKSLFIADGHHRYETALNFRRLMREELGPGYPKAYDWVMMYFANMSSPGLTILPFHRLLSLPSGSAPEEVLRRLGTVGELRPMPAAEDRRQGVSKLLEAMGQARAGEQRFGVLTARSGHLLVYRTGAAAGGPREMVEALDVSVLHRVILERALAGEPGGATISYATREEDILRQMDSGACQVAILLNPTRIEQVRDIAAAGLRMPPKSTNFHPKLISGLVMNLLSD